MTLFVRYSFIPAYPSLPLNNLPQGFLIAIAMPHSQIFPLPPKLIFYSSQFISNDPKPEALLFIFLYVKRFLVTKTHSQGYFRQCISSSSNYL